MDFTKAKERTRKKMAVEMKEQVQTSLERKKVKKRSQGMKDERESKLEKLRQII
jgi:hypothetical protein